MAEGGGDDEDDYYSDRYSDSYDSRSSYDSYDSRDSRDSRSESPLSDTEARGTQKFYITKESQKNITEASRKESYTGLRDLTDLDKVQERDIVDADGSVRGVENRVRAGLANFENREALEKKKQEEGKIIVYITSFRGVRSTFEDCVFVKRVLHNYLVKFEEKDIYVNKHYNRELKDRLKLDSKSKLPVPQIFISGQHIGGKEEFEELNETGELRRLLETFSRLETVKECGYCGGYEFIPCRKCGGTKDSVRNNFTNEFKALRCTHCNENGLEPCPGCKGGTDGGDAWDEEELKKWRERQEHERKEEEEKRKQEKRERIKREALEAEFQKQLKKERERAERERVREEKRKKKSKEVAAMTKIADEIEFELEKEKQWRVERKLSTNDSS